MCAADEVGVLVKDRAFTLRIDYRGCVLEPSGEFDAGTTAEFVDGVRALLETMADGTLLIDLRHVTFIDSSGLGALVVACNVAKMKNVLVALRSVPAHITRLIRVTGLTSVLLPEPSTRVHDGPGNAESAK